MEITFTSELGVVNDTEYPANIHDLKGIWDIGCLSGADRLVQGSGWIETSDNMAERSLCYSRCQKKAE